MNFALLRQNHFVVTAMYTVAKNTTIDSFAKAKSYLQQHVYGEHRITVYGDAKFDEKKNVSPLVGPCWRRPEEFILYEPECVVLPTDSISEEGIQPFRSVSSVT
jgi:hypothetical protein